MPANPLHLRIAANERGRDFLLGDLHGMRAAFDAALETRGFDPAVDRVFSVGDLVDRGPESPACFDLLDEPWFYAVRGNHEQMMIDAVLGGTDPVSWYANGGGWAFRVDPEDLSTRVRAALSRLPLAITLELTEGGAIGLCHAEYPRSDWSEVEAAAADPDDRFDMLWGRRVVRSRESRRTAGVRRTVHGHTPLAEPMRRGDALFIDLGLVYGGEMPLFTVADALAIPDRPPLCTPRPGDIPPR